MPRVTQPPPLFPDMNPTYEGLIIEDLQFKLDGVESDYQLVAYENEVISYLLENEG